jgi:tetratricopeptide (TPR) repeat protein
MAGGSQRVYDLAAARPDGWFEAVLEQSADFDKACQIIGRHTLALALIAGARVLSITANPQSHDLTAVEFSIGQDPTVRQLPLPEFRRTIGRYLLVPLQSEGLPDDPDVESLQMHIGGRYMLEAVLFQVQPLELRYDLGLSEVAIEFNGLRHVLALDDLRDILDERVRSELGLDRREEVSIDLKVVDQAEEANEHGNWSATVALLNPWLGSISMLLRTGEAEGLSKEVRARLSTSLDLLGTAYAELGELDAANEVLRLGVQWAGESSEAADLFLALGRASVAGGKHGEAIGLLRRAIRLGASEHSSMPLLAQSLASREQWLAAMVCAERARELGAADSSMDSVTTELEERLGEAWPRFQAWFRG